MPDVIADLERGRALYAGRSWTTAAEAFETADRTASLGAGDLELLARCVYMLGRDDGYVAVLERAFQAYLETGSPARAALRVLAVAQPHVARRGRAGGGLAEPRRAPARGARR